MKAEYLVVYYKSQSNFSGYAPDVLGCVSAGDTLEEMRAMIAEALEFHFEGTIAEGLPIPPPKTTTIDFSREDFDPDLKYAVVEWLEVNVPQRKSENEFAVAS
jgi:predicted RNase H-like HicB family nuclease